MACEHASVTNRHICRNVRCNDVFCCINNFFQQSTIIHSHNLSWQNVLNRFGFLYIDSDGVCLLYCIIIGNHLMC